jgi:Binding-prot-dependent transport system membrane comp, N-term
VLQFLIRRLFWAFFLFFVATVITYIIFFVIPTNPAQIACGVHCAPAILIHVEHSLHLNLPIYQQYWLFIWNMIKHQSLGYSLTVLPYAGSSARTRPSRHRSCSAARSSGSGSPFRSESCRPCGRGRSSTGSQ